MTIVEMDTRQVPLHKMYFSMAFPVVLSMVTAMVYNIADTWFISATGVTELIAGVSLNAPVLTLLMAFGNIYGQGGSSLISRLIGLRDSDSVRRISAMCFWLAIATGIAAGGAMLIFCRPLLLLLGADADTMQYASSYFICIAVGAPFIITSYIPTNLLRSEGLSRESMTASISGTVVNIILDPIFIFGLGLGAMGAAIATVLGYVFMDVYAVGVTIKKSSLLSVDIRDAHISPAHAAQIFGTGIPAAITNITQSISQVLVNQFLLAYGNDKIAAMGIACKASMAGSLVLVGLTFGALPLFGYYYGGGNKKKFLSLFRFCMSFVCAAALVLTVILSAGSGIFIKFFVSDAGLIEAGTLMLRLQAATLVFAGIVLLITIVFQSMGRTVPMLILSVSRQGVIFLIVLLIASAAAGYYGVISSQAVSDVISAVLALALVIPALKKLSRDS